MLLPPPRAPPITRSGLAAGHVGCESRQHQCSHCRRSRMECAAHKSCVWTSPRGESVVPAMDADTADLVDQICTRIGMMMEEASVIALTTRRLSNEQRVAAVAQLRTTTRIISALAEAAKMLIEPVELRTTD